MNRVVNEARELLIKAAKNYHESPSSIVKDYNNEN